MFCGKLFLILVFSYLGLLRIELIRHDISELSKYYKCLLGNVSGEDMGNVVIEAQGYKVNYHVAASSANSILESLEFFNKNSNDLIRQVDFFNEASMVFGDFIGTVLEVNPFMSSNVRAVVHTTDGVLQGPCSESALQGSVYLFSANLDGESGSKGRMDMKVNGNVVDYSFSMNNVMGDLSFDEILSVDIIYSVDNGAHSESGIVHSLDIDALTYTNLGESGDKYLLRVTSFDQSFLVSDILVDYFSGGLMFVQVKTKTFPDGDAIGKAHLASTSRSYAIIEVALGSNGFIDMTIDGNVVFYSFNLTNLTSPVYDIRLHYNNDMSADDHFPAPESIFSEGEGRYSAKGTGVIYLIDSKIAYLLEENAVFEVSTVHSHDEGLFFESTGFVEVIYVESKTADMMMSANLNGATEASGIMNINITGNFVTYSFSMSDFYSAVDDGGSEITSITFHYTENHGHVMETHFVHSVDLDTIVYYVDTFDTQLSMYRLYANLTEDQMFRAGDDVIDLFSNSSMSVTVTTKTHPEGEISGPVQ